MSISNQPVLVADVGIEWVHANCYPRAVKISIVVPAYNEEKFLGETLAQIKTAAGVFTNLGWQTELIVCDNHSTDRTAEIARAAGAKVVFEPVNQISRARNAGAAAATGDWLVFVDADSRPSEALMREVAGEIQSGNCLAGGATVRWDERHFVFDLLTSMINVGYPLAAAAGRRVYVRRNGGLPKTRRLQPGSVGRRGFGNQPAIEKARQGNRKTICHSASASDRDLGTQIETAHDIHAVQNGVAHFISSASLHRQPRSRPLLV